VSDDPAPTVAQQVSQADSAPVAPKDASFEALLVRGANVRLGDVVRAKVLSSPRLTADPGERAVGEHFYPLTLKAFQDSHKGVQFVIQEDVGFGVVLYAAEQADPEGDKVDWAVIRRTLRFDWSLPRALLIETQELADEARGSLCNPTELRDLLGLLYNVLTQIGATIGKENRLCPPDQDESGEPPSGRIAQDISIIQKQLDAARAHFQRNLERAAQTIYARGMVLGTVAMLVLCGAIAGILAIEGVGIINAIGLAAGAVGASVSVLERMTRGKLEINVQSGERLLLAFGALRPVVGGIFGFLIYLIIRAELISIFVLPKHHAAALAYVAVFGFVAGFNERFAQDMLANASNTRRED
jgi:hypothetical protein